MSHGFFGTSFQVMHEAVGDVAAGDNADQMIVAVEHGEAAEFMAIELGDGAHQREMVAECDHIAGHVFLSGFIDVSLAQRVDNVLNADQCPEVFRPR